MKNTQEDCTNSKGEHGFITHLRKSSRHPATSIFDLDFADDIALLSSSASDCQKQLLSQKKHANNVGLKINFKKTEIMTNQTSETPKFLLEDDQELDIVDNFKYLGAMMLSCETDIKIRKGQAWGAFWKMKSIWHSSSIPTKLKINIFNASCLSILLYGCESWVITKSLESTLNTFALNCYRIMLNIRRTQHISNKEIYNRTKQVPLATTVQQRQLRFVGHCLRRNENEPIHQYVLYTPSNDHGKRKTGKPKISYASYISKLVSKDPKSPWTVEDIKNNAADRKEWRKLVIACKPIVFADD